MLFKTLRAKQFSANRRFGFSGFDKYAEGVGA